MCGIVGIVGNRPAAADLVEALRRLEYRGYDSAGIATVENGTLRRLRAEGKLCNLERKLSQEPLSGATGIGHTRWATHGRPVEHNAHPHMNGQVSVVHNGIIENYRELRAELESRGHRFESDTDTETAVHLISEEMAKGLEPAEAVQAALARLRGAFALGILFAGHDDLLIAARRGSPLAIGHGDGTMYLGSDAIALAPFTGTITYLEEGDMAVLNRSGATVFAADGRKVMRPAIKPVAAAFLVDKGNHRHFMAKEIHEQPEVLSRTLAHYLDMTAGRVNLPDLGADPLTLSRVTITACGTAYYAALCGKYWIERYARLPVEIDVASEFRYREAPLPPAGLALFVSQSGETADTLAALRYCKTQGQHTAAIVNVRTSTIARESHAILPTLAGPEIGVASTKAFTCQLAVLACLAIGLGRVRGVLDEEEERTLIKTLIEVPRHVSLLVAAQTQYEALAQSLAKARDVLYIGRGMSYPLALEGALKLKEISYIHAEGYAAGELKHGPIALIDESVPVIALAPEDGLFEKTVSNMQEVAARGGQIIFVSSATPAKAGCRTAAHIPMPDALGIAAPLLYAIPVQLLAYHTAVFMGTDVDQPRNLAKSVTVE